jgi:hypothetical protein
MLIISCMLPQIQSTSILTTPDTIHTDFNYLSDGSFLDLVIQNCIWKKNRYCYYGERLECILHNLWNYTKRHSGFGYQDSRLNLMVQWWKYQHHSHRLFSSHEICKHFKTIFLDNISIHQKNSRTFPPNREDLFGSFHTIVSWFTEQYRHLSKITHSKHPLNPTIPTIISIVTERFYHPICVYCITLYFHNAH